MGKRLAKKIRLPKVIRRKDGYWIPRFPPHYYQSMGPYDSRQEAEDDRLGVQQTINTPAWRLLVKEMEHER